jgi:hypothetical protein
MVVQDIRTGLETANTTLASISNILGQQDETGSTIHSLLTESVGLLSRFDLIFEGWTKTFDNLLAELKKQTSIQQDNLTTVKEIKDAVGVLQNTGIKVTKVDGSVNVVNKETEPLWVLGI